MITKFKNTWNHTAAWARKNGALLLILGVGIWWFSPESAKPMPYEYTREEAIQHTRNLSSGMGRMMKMAQAPVEMMADMASPEIALADDGFSAEAQDRKIVKNAHLSLEVVDTDTTKILVEAEVEKLQGAISNLNSWEVRPGQLGYNLSIQVPAESLEVLLENLAKLGIKKSENYSVSDITEQYFDTGREIEILETELDWYLNRFDNIDEVSEVFQYRNEIRRLKMQLEGLQKTQNRRDRNVTYSSVQLSLQPESLVGDVQNPHWSATKSWRTSVNDLITTLQYIFDRTLKLVVYTPIWLPILLLLMWAKRRFL